MFGALANILIFDKKNKNKKKCILNCFLPKKSFENVFLKPYSLIKPNLVRTTI
jgi:hypothetical protein